MITTRQVTKRYGRILAVDRVNLDVHAGDRYGLLGPNGSGKTTLLRIVLGLVYATSGEVTLLGQPIPRRVGSVLPYVGALVDGPAAYGHLSAHENLYLLDAAGPAAGARTTRRRRVADVLDRVGLGGIDHRPVRTYSMGMRQRLGLAAALMRAPRLLVLDEPTNGLDPQGIREVRDLLRELNDRGTTVVLSSHLLAEVDALCTHVGIMDRGRLVLQEPLEPLRAATGRVIVRTPDVDRALAVLDGRVVSCAGHLMLVRGGDAARLNAELVAAGITVSELREERRTLEDVVLDVTSPGSDRVDRSS